MRRVECPRVCPAIEASHFAGGPGGGPPTSPGPNPFRFWWRTEAQIPCLCLHLVCRGRYRQNQSELLKELASYSTQRCVLPVCLSCKARILEHSTRCWQTPGGQLQDCSICFR